MEGSEEVLRQLRIERRQRPQARRRRWPWLLALAAAALALAWLLLGNRPVPVDTVEARPAEAGGGSVLDASGYVTARRLATVSAKITGKVEEVLIEEGMRVEADQVLARLEAVDALAQQALAEAQLDAARTQLGEVRANLRLAEQNLERQRSLLDRRLVAQAQLDQAQAEFDTAQARQASLSRQVEVARSQVELARIGVDNTIVRAPFAGVVVAKAAQPGEIVSPISAGGGFTRTGIGTIVDMDSLEVEVDVNEAYIGRVLAGQPVEAVLNAYPDWRIPGSVIAIIPTADRAKATVRVRIALDVEDPRIVPDMGVRVSFLEQARADAPPPRGVWVPARAIVERDGASVAFVVDGDRVRQVPVEAGERRDADRQVLAGVAEGDVVVVGPPETLADGDRVQAGRGR